MKSTRKPVLETLVANVRSNGREVERALQIAAGTVCLTIVASLPSVWTEIVGPLGGLRLALVGTFYDFATVFFLTLMAMFYRARITYEESGNSSPVERLASILFWFAPIALAVLLILWSSHSLATTLLWESEKELALKEGTPLPTEGRRISVEDWKTELQQRRDALISPGP